MTLGYIFRAGETPASALQVLHAAGRPLFDDPALQGVLASSGANAAWAQGLAQSGPALLHRVGGTFSIAWRQADGCAFLAVDRFAVQSLCFRHEGDSLHFAERADTLGTRSDADLDPQALYDYLFFHAIPSPRTIFRGVQRLAPGHLAEFDRNGKLSCRPYWQAQFKPFAKPDFASLRETFRDRLKTATRRQLDGTKPACFLSGGTDSSTVAGMIGLAGGTPAHTYSIGFEAEGYDEMAFARIAAKHFGCTHHEYYVTPGDLVDRMASVAQYYDQPFGNSSAVPAYFCARMAQADGVTRILAGDGGDELFGGNTRYAKQTVFGWYDRVPAPLRTGLLEPLLQRQVMGNWPGLKKVASYSEQARVPMPDRMHSYNLLERLGVAEVLTADFLAQVNPAQPHLDQRQIWQAITADNDIDRMLAYDWRYTLAETDLPKVMGTTALAGVSVGFPMLDLDLLDLALGLPADWKVKRLKLRWFFKEALKGFLPDEIIQKPKQGFGLPFGVWAHRDKALFALCEDALQSLARRNIVRRDFIEQLLRVHLPSHPKYYGEMVWILVMLELWLNRPA
jgi:asparagine synthase (glutamine-hydrolysing)